MPVVTKPTSTLLLDPEEVRTRLNAPTSAATAIQRIVTRVSSIIAEQLAFDPWYQEVIENFRGDDCRGNTLNLAWRPFVRLVSVVDPNGITQTVDEDFEIIPTERRSGEVYLHRPDTWFNNAFWAGAVGAKWAVRYWAGWWLPLMTGERPEEVETLPEDIAEAAWITCQFRWASDATNPAIAEVSKGGARVTFRDRNASAFPRGYNTDVGSAGIPLPAEVMSILAPYLPNL